MGSAKVSEESVSFKCDRQYRHNAIAPWLTRALLISTNLFIMLGQLGAFDSASCNDSELPISHCDSLRKALLDRTPEYNSRHDFEVTIHGLMELLDSCVDKDSNLTRIQIYQKLGTAHLLFADLTDKSENATTALKYYGMALDQCPYKKYPHEWIECKLGLGESYRLMAEVQDREKNLRISASNIKEIIQSGLVDEYVHTQGLPYLGLGIDYLYLTECPEMVEFLQLAIHYFQSDLKDIEERLSKQNRGVTWLRLGHAYTDLSMAPNKKVYLDDAVNAYDQAAQILTECHDTSDQVMAVSGMGSTYLQKYIDGGDSSDIAKAITLHEEALSLLGQADSLAYACNSWYLAEDHARRSERESPVINTEKAMSVSEKGLRMVSAQFYPHVYARLLQQYGSALTKMAVHVSRSVYADSAIKVLELAQSILGQSLIPWDNYYMEYDLAQAYSFLAQTRDKKENYEKALVHVEASLSSIEQEFDPSSYLRALYLMGTIRGKKGWETRDTSELVKSIANFEEALQTQEKYQVPAMIVQLYVGLASAYARIAEVRDKRQNLEKALLYFQKGQELASKTGDPVAYSTLLNNLATTYRFLGAMENPVENYNQAIRLYRENLVVVPASQSRLVHAQALANLGTAYSGLWGYTNNEVDLANAIDYYDSSLAASDSVADRSMYLSTKGDLVRAKSQFLVYTDSLSVCEWTAAAYQSIINDPYMIRDTLYRAVLIGEQGTLFLNCVDIGDTLEYCTKAIDAFEFALKEMGNRTTPDLVALYQSNMAEVHLNLSYVRDPEAHIWQALGMIKRSQETFTLESDTIQFSRCKHLLGWAYLRFASIRDTRENLNRAIAYYDTALVNLKEGTNSDMMARSTNDLGECYLAMAEVSDKSANLEKALAYFQEARRLAALKSPKRLCRYIDGNLTKVNEKISKL